MEVPLIYTKGGHFVITMRSISGADSNNIKGEEADAVMWMIFEHSDSESIKKIHDEIGHTTFVNIALNDDEEAHVKKVHRYFGHRSGRRVWDIFTKVGEKEQLWK